MRYSFTATALLAAAGVISHVVLESPKPFDLKGLVDGISNPMTADDFPTKLPAGKSLPKQEPTVMAIGEDQFLSVKGGAVHGGGSCQIALTADAQPTKDTVWKVIHSIEGGCPARNVKGNLDGANTDKYQYKIPAGIAPGAYTLLWTWYPRGGGQPEFYGAVAPIMVVAAKGKRQDAAERRAEIAKRVEFPDLFMANLGTLTGGCTTDAGRNSNRPIKFPNPGASVERNEGESGQLVEQTCDGNPRAKGGKPATGSSAVSEQKTSAATSSQASTQTQPKPSTASAQPATSSKSSAQSSTQTTPKSSSSSTQSATSTSVRSTFQAPVSPSAKSAPRTSAASNTTSLKPTTLQTSAKKPSSAPTMEKTVTVTVTAGIATTTVKLSSAPAQEKIVTVTVTAGLATTTVRAPASTVSPTSRPSTGDSGPCPVEGHLLCLSNGRQFATCTGGKWTAPQPIAPGFQCKPGYGVGLETSPITRI